MSDYDRRVQDLYSDEDIRDVHALNPPFSPLGSSPFMNTIDRASSRGGFSNMSVTNSTLVMAGSPLSSLIGDSGSVVTGDGRDRMLVSVTSFKKEEVESKIIAWKNAKVSEINNRFKCEDAIINGWESEQAEQSALRMKKVERKLEEKRVKALEKMENEIAKAHHKAEERRASAEAKRGTKIARVIEVANLMKAVGRAPVKKAFF